MNCEQRKLRRFFPTPWRWTISVVWLAVWFFGGGEGCNQSSSAPPPLLQIHEAASQSPHYVVYSSFETGPATYVRALKQDGNTLWVGTSRGILAVDHTTGNLLQTVTRASSGNKLASDYIFTINVDSAGVVWFGTNNGGLAKFDRSRPAGEQWENYLPVHGLADFWVYDIAYAADGVMWIGTWDGVSRYDPRAKEGKKFTNFNEADGLANKWVYTVAVDRDQSAWFGTESGVSRFDPAAPAGRQWRTWRHEDGLGAPNALALKRSKNTGMGTRTRTGGYSTRHDLSVLDETGNETYNENYVFSMAIDRAGVKWIGTWGGGLSRFDSKAAFGQWRNYDKNDGLAGNVVYAVEIDDHGVLWLGTNHGLSRFDPNGPAGQQWMKWTVADGLLGDDVYAIVPASTGTIWVGQKGGVVELGPDHSGQQLRG